MNMRERLVIAAAFAKEKLYQRIGQNVEPEIRKKMQTATATEITSISKRIKFGFQKEKVQDLLDNNARRVANTVQNIFFHKAYYKNAGLDVLAPFGLSEFSRLHEDHPCGSI
jgi:hypothetical protein